MNKNFMLLLGLLILGSCKQNKSAEPASPLATTPEFLQGTWRNVVSQNPDFRLAADSVEFLQEGTGEKYAYTLSGDSLTFHFPTYDFSFRVYCYAGDSIHLDNEMNSNTFLKVK